MTVFADRLFGPLDVVDGHAIAALAVACLGVKETTQNRGPDVDRLVSQGGGKPSRAWPWCAYFVSAVVDEARRRGFDVRHSVKTGRAVKHWAEAETRNQITCADFWCLPPDMVAGLIFVRTRTSRPVTDADRVREGAKQVQGHTGIVLSMSQDRGLPGFIAVAGNSTGAGHSYVRGSGSVALEHYGRGGAGASRLVGFVDPIGAAADYLEAARV